MNSPIITRSGAQRAKIQTRAMVKSNTSTKMKTSTGSGITNTATAANSTAYSSAAASMSSGGGGTASSVAGANTGSVEPRRPNPALLEAKKRARLLKMQQQQQQQNCSGNGIVIVGGGNGSGTIQEGVTDIFQNAVNAKNLVRRPTGLIFDESMSKHRCLWDDNHPERPERFTRVLERCRELKLPERCQIIPSRAASKHEILLLHTAEHYEALERTSGVDNAVDMEDLSSKYDSIYIHPSTFELSLLATGCTIDLIENICGGKVQNGMAIIRPPGHHAMKAEFNGYCFFNNVAVATQYALDILKLKKIMIIDWDIHHGQGTQRFFYNDSRVLYFSIHRFEHGTFWPNLKESNFDAIGVDDGCGYNFNVPLNRTGMGNSEYLAIFQQLVVPVALEYQPELIIISAGYDAALGCPEGEMEVTPACYAHLINSLEHLADSRIAVVLEGGYCLDSLAEGASLTLRALLGDPCPQLIEKIEPPCTEIQDAILNCIYAHRPYWKCLQVQQTYTMEDVNNVNPQMALHKVKRNFIGGPPLPDRFQTRDTGPKIPLDVTERQMSRLSWLKAETKLAVPPIRVCYAYDDFLLQHQNLYDDGHPEQPKRIKRIFQMHQEYKLLERMQQVKTRTATTDEICLAHTRAHVNFIRRITEKENLQELGTKYNSVYFHPKTFDCATMAAGSVLQVVDQVLTGGSTSGVCIVRPPGHHAEADVPHGFCIFNNVAIAAQYAIRDHGLKRVLIVDWDVHHGNGTQHIFESNPQVLYVSVHRYENGSFFPKGPDGNFDAVGKGIGIGYNVNIPWNKKGMGDLEYAMAFQQIIMPIAYEFKPELVLVSAGFDAAIGDPLGGCKVSPEAYGLFTHWLSALAGGRLIVCLEGGYNINSISYAMTMCTKALLGDPIPTVQLNMQPARPSTAAYMSCIETLQHCLDIQRTFWRSLAFAKKLPKYANAENNNEEEDFLTVTLQQLNISNDDAQGMAGGSDVAEVLVSSPQPSGSKPKVKVKTLRDYLAEHSEALENEEMFAVIPLKHCPHLVQIESEKAPKLINTDAECNDCSSTIENWICLSCRTVGCGRYINEHMLYHSLQTEHSLALSFSDLSVWCYACEAYLDNPCLYNFKNAAHRYKFGEEMPSNTITSTSTTTNVYSITMNNNDDDDDDKESGAATTAYNNLELQLPKQSSNN